MNRIQVILTIDMENLPQNFPEILKQEQEIVAKWKEEGFLDHLFLRQSKNGAVLIFKDLDEIKVKELMEKLPFYKLKKNIEYLNVTTQRVWNKFKKPIFFNFNSSLISNLSVTFFFSL
jgi:muconolactone D-isomerase